MRISIRIRQNKFYGRRKNKTYYKSLKQQLEHDFRLEDMDEGYIENPDQEDSNIYIGGGDRPREDWVEYITGRAEVNFLKAQLDYKKHWGQKMHPKTNEVITGLFNYSEHFQIPDPDLVVNALGHFLKKKFGNCLHLSFHADEHGTDKAGHFHFSLLNYDFRTHKTIGRNIDTSILQDEMIDWLKKEGLAYGHERGKASTDGKLPKRHLEVMELMKLKYQGTKKQLDQTEEELSKARKEVEQLHQDSDYMRSELYQYANDLVALGADEEKIQRKLEIGIKYADSNKTYKMSKLLEKFSNLSQKLKTSPMKTATALNPPPSTPFKPPSPFDRKP